MVLRRACGKASFELRSTLTKRLTGFIPVSRKREGGRWFLIAYVVGGK